MTTNEVSYKGRATEGVTADSNYDYYPARIWAAVEEEEEEEAGLAMNIGMKEGRWIRRFPCPAVCLAGSLSLFVCGTKLCSAVGNPGCPANQRSACPPSFDYIIQCQAVVFQCDHVVHTAHKRRRKPFPGSPT
jgi:hypothetical protein